MGKMGKMGKSHKAYPDKFAYQGLAEFCNIPERPHSKVCIIWDWCPEEQKHVQYWWDGKKKTPVED